MLRGKRDLAGTDSEGNTGRMILFNSTFDKERSISRFIRRFELTLADGSEIKEDIPSLKHFAALEQVHTWLSSNGFIVVEEYGDYDRSPISEGKSILAFALYYLQVSHQEAGAAKSRLGKKQQRMLSVLILGKISKGRDTGEN